MNLLDTLQRLQAEASALRDSWQKTRSGWTDNRARQFERTHVEALVAELARYAGELESLGRTGVEVARTLEL